MVEMILNGIFLFVVFLHGEEINVLESFDLNHFHHLIIHNRIMEIDIGT